MSLHGTQIIAITAGKMASLSRNRATMDILISINKPFFTKKTQKNN